MKKVNGHTIALIVLLAVVCSSLGVFLTTCVKDASEHEAPALVIEAPQPTQQETKTTIQSVPETTVLPQPQEVMKDPDTQKPVVDDQPVYATYDQHDVSVSIASYDGHADVTYPSSIAQRQVRGFLDGLASQNPAVADAMSYSFEAPGNLAVTYPKGISPQARKAALDTIVADLDGYVAQQIAAAQKSVVVEQPAVESKPEAKPTIEATTEQPVSVKYDQHGVSVSVDSYDGHAQVAYPASVSDDQVHDYISHVVATHPAIVKDVKYSIDTAGKLSATYPKGISAQDRKAALDTLVGDLNSYITDKTSSPATVTPVAPVVEKQPEPTAPVVPAVAKQDDPVTVSYDNHGITASVVSYDGHGAVTYPSFVSDVQIGEFVNHLISLHPTWFKQVEYVPVGTGKLDITYPAGLSIADRTYALKVLVDELDAYLAEFQAYKEDLPQQVDVPSAIPAQPFMFEPAVYTLEEWYSFFGGFEETSSNSDDPFADFFVAGEGDIDYEDGWYYMTLYVNDEYYGDIEILIDENGQSINSVELSYLLGDTITNEFSQKIFGDGSEYVTFQELTDLGVTVDYDPSQFIVRLTFDTQAMPVRTISLNSYSYMSRRDRYSLNGAIVLEPAKFSWVSQFSLYSMLDVNSGFVNTSQLFSLSVSNNLAIFDVGLDFYFQVNQRSPYFHFGSWRGFYDFIDDNIRLSFGNIGGGIGNASGTSVGVSLEKNYSYGTGTAKSHQYEQTITLTARSKVTVVMNDRVVYERELAAGTYSLKDFVFSQGTNGIDITVTPVNPEDGQTVTYHFNLGYDSRLLAKGESLWGFSFSFPRAVVPAGTEIGLAIPWFDNQKLDYQFQNFSMNYWQQTGLTNIFTLSTNFSVAKDVFLANFSGVLATNIGPLNGAFAVSLTPIGLGYSTSLNYRYSASSSWFNSFDVSAGYTNGTYSVSSNPASTVGKINANLSFSGRIGSFLRFSVGSNVGIPVNTYSPDWSVTGSVGMSPLKGLSISASMTASAVSAAADKPTIRGALSVSYSFGSSASVSVNTDFNTGNSINASWRPGSKRRDSLQLSVSGINFQDPLNHSLSMSWSHVGDLFSLSLRQQFSNTYQRSVTSLSLNTSFVFADGVFGMARSVSDNFLLVRPFGQLKGATVSVGRSMDSSPTVLKSVFGTSVYNNLSRFTKNHVVVFGSSSSLFGSGGTFVYEMTPESRRGYVAKINITPSYTVSACLFDEEGNPYMQYSSPVYRMEYDEENMPVLQPVDDYYLFTDQEGRFIISDMLPGDYLFDLQVKDSWYAVRFTVPAFDDKKKSDENVLVYSDFKVGDTTLLKNYKLFDDYGSEIKGEELDVFGTMLADEYSAIVELNLEGRVNEQEFWDTIFPMFSDDFINETFDETSFDADGNYVETDSQKMVADSLAALTAADASQTPDPSLYNSCVATVSYPEYVTNEEVDAFCTYIEQLHPDWFKDVTYTHTLPGIVVFSFPRDVAHDDMALMLDTLAGDLNAYLKMMFGQVPEVPVHVSVYGHGYEIHV